ncbi:MAG: hypothetical protein AB1705_27515, partial [Verrucomicrobiota bacterium]
MHRGRLIFIIGGILAIAFLVVVLVNERAAVVNFTNGGYAEFVAATSGPTAPAPQPVPDWQARLDRYANRLFGRRVFARIGSGSSGRSWRSNIPQEESVHFWFAGHPALELRQHVYPGSTARTAFAVTEDGWLWEPYGDARATPGSVPLHALSFSQLPRWDRRITLRFYHGGSGDTPFSGALTVDNPARRTAPVRSWSPLPLPQTVRTNGVEFTLTG